MSDIANDFEGCSVCVLPANFPGVNLVEGICQYCRDNDSGEKIRAQRQILKDELDEVLNNARGEGDYDVIVAFSGGKDSSYILAELVREYSLRALAITIDNGFVSEQAKKNAAAVTARLGVDHLVFTPNFDFMSRMYRASAERPDLHPPAAIKRASAMCNSCINLINIYMVKMALRHECEIIAGGYIAGQVPKDAAVMKLDVGKHLKMNNHTLNKYVGHLGSQSEKYFSLQKLERFANERRLLVVNPMLAMTVSESEIIDTVSELGWERPSDTGVHSSNCQLNDLGIAIHYKQHGFHPYVAEIAEQVRAGTMSRDDAMRRIQDVKYSGPPVEAAAAKLGLDPGMLL
ncbi:MAG: hypothetical protein AAF387_19595 [Pseudomonadota bacterium]